MFLLSKLFHKKVSSEKPRIPKKRGEWPESWKIILFKQYPRFKKINLPKEFLELKNLKEVLEQRTSSRMFNKEKKISIEELSTILHYSAGIKNKTRRFYPSGGARYPLEIYITIKRVGNIEPGIYHYNVTEHSLEKLLGSENLKNFDETLGYTWAQDAPVIFITTAVWNRNFVKYDDFGYNLILIEAGHIGQNIQLVSQSLNLKYCPLVGFNNDKLNEVLDIKEEIETSLYITAISK